MTSDPRTSTTTTPSPAGSPPAQLRSSQPKGTPIETLDLSSSPTETTQQQQPSQAAGSSGPGSSGPGSSGRAFPGEAGPQPEKLSSSELLRQRAQSELTDQLAELQALGLDVNSPQGTAQFVHIQSLWGSSISEHAQPGSTIKADATARGQTISDSSKPQAGLATSPPLSLTETVDLRSSVDLSPTVDFSPSRESQDDDSRESAAGVSTSPIQNSTLPDSSVPGNPLQDTLAEGTATVDDPEATQNDLGVTVDFAGASATPEQPDPAQGDLDREDPGKTEADLGATGPDLSATLKRPDLAGIRLRWLVDRTGTSHQRSSHQESGHQESSHQESGHQESSHQTGGEPQFRGDYQLVRLLGEGGMGAVYLARQETLRRDIAVKLLKPRIAKDPEQQAKFLAEATITGVLDHPNIVPVHDLGSSHDGTIFYAMKRVRGTPWSDAFFEKPLPENLDILLRVCDAVAFAHSRRVIHRDLKPENVMLGDFGEVLVMDWGLALPLNEQGRPDLDDGHWGIAGTPAYLPPEMATGPISAVGAHSDVYLLGAILYELLTGRPPHPGQNVMGCLFAASQNTIHPTEQKGELVEIAHKAMSTDPAHRHGSVGEFQEAIRLYQSHSESVLLSNQAGKQLHQGESTGDRDRLNNALYGFKQAYELWDRNTEAARGVVQTQLALARVAYSGGDFDLAASLLDPQQPEHAKLRTEVLAALHSRAARQAGYRMLQRVAWALAAVIVLGSVAATAVIWQATKKARENYQFALQEAHQANIARDQADQARKKEHAARQDAERQAHQAEIARNQADQARKKEHAARQEAEQKAQEARSARQVAEQRKQEADAARQVAEQKKQEAEAARDKEIVASYQGRIGLADAKILENTFRLASEQLRDCKKSSSDLLNWEWGHLRLQTQLDRRTFLAHHPSTTAVAFVPASQQAASQQAKTLKQVVTAGLDNTAKLWEVSTGKLLKTFPVGSNVYAVAASPKGGQIITGDARGQVILWDLASGRPRQLAQHDAEVVTLAISSDGRYLISGGGIWAILTDLTTAKPRRAMLHQSYVQDVACWGTGSNLRVLTADDQGQAGLWTMASNPQGIPFRQPDGSVPAATRAVFWQAAGGQPVRAVAFGGRSDVVFTSGDDQTIRQWSIFTTNQDPKPLQVLPQQATIRDLFVFDNGQGLIAGSQDHTARIWRYQRNGQNNAAWQEVRILRGHSGGVVSLDWWPEQNHVLTGSADGTAKLWNPADAESSLRIQVQSEPVVAADLSADGRLLLSGSNNRSAYVIDVSANSSLAAAEGPRVLASLQEGEGLKSAKRPGGLYWAVTCTRDGRLTAGSQDGGVIRLWNSSTGEALREFTGAKKEIRSLALSSDGRWLLAGDEAGWVYRWDVSTGKLVQTYQYHNKAQTGSKTVTSLAWSPPGDPVVFLSADGSGRAALWSLTGSKPLRFLPSDRRSPHTDAIVSAAIVPDPAGQARRLVVTASWDQTICLWNLDTGRKLASLTQKTDRSPLIRGKRVNMVNAISVTPDGRWAVSGGIDGHLWVWDLKARQLAKTVPLRQPGGRLVVISAAISPNGRQAVVATSDKRLGVYELANSNNQAAASRPLETGQNGVCYAMRSVNAAPAAQDLGGMQLLLSRPSGLEWVRLTADQLAGKDKTLPEVTMKLGPHAAISAVAFINGPNRAQPRFALTAGTDGAVKLWDLQPFWAEGKTPRVKRRWIGSNGRRVNTIAVSPQGNRFAVGGDDRVVRVFPLEAGPLVELSGHQGGVTALAFSSDGNQLLSGSRDHKAILWDLGNGTALKELSGHTWSVLSVDFLNDRPWALTGSRDNTARLWNLLTGECLAELKGHTGAVEAVRFLNADRALTGSLDGTAVIWDLSLVSQQEARELLTLRGEHRGVRVAGYHRDTRRVFTAGDDGTIVFWRAKRWKQMASAKAPGPSNSLNSAFGD